MVDFLRLRAALHEVRCAECRVTWTSWLQRILGMKRGMTPKLSVPVVSAPVSAYLARHTVDLPLTPHEHRLEAAFQLERSLNEYDWSTLWTVYSNYDLSYLQCEGPANPLALKTIEEWAKAHDYMIWKGMP